MAALASPYWESVGLKERLTLFIRILCEINCHLNTDNLYFFVLLYSDD